MDLQMGCSETQMLQTTTTVWSPKNGTYNIPWSFIFFQQDVCLPGPTETNLEKLLLDFYNKISDSQCKSTFTYPFLLNILLLHWKFLAV